ncbi:putative membrane protein [Paenalcaligenes hominis]|uniref:Membrane protein n=1 Tax=Paenalcaligenes hominis TaxID=643674 RepID=A0ABX0WTV9_9BURK|nr:DUF4142 domain-containing protein [Paenalcaligenes hominis]NJB66198.1 putative membrane protein [Paenalcaligenes hominis]GGE73183.1 hypothetical protein GCM10007278_21780 [Paenalcaligenes hominis]
MYLRGFAVAGFVGVALCLITMKPSQANELSMSDRNFLKEAAQAGHYEIESANEALARSQDKQVQEFARMMLQEHERIDKELNALAVAKDQALPTSASMMQQGKVLLLKGKEGHEFDQYYAEHLAIKAHEDAIELFEKQAKNGDDDEITGFAQDVLPLLKQHLQHAQSLKNHVDSTKP